MTAPTPEQAERAISAMRGASFPPQSGVLLSSGYGSGRATVERIAQALADEAARARKEERERAEKLAEALRLLLDEQSEHPLCDDDGSCPVRAARAALAKWREETS